MDAKHRLVQLVAALGVALAGLLCFAALNRFHFGMLLDGWAVADSLFMLALGSYLMARSMRAWDWATAKANSKAGSVQWGRILLGSWIIYLPIKTHLDTADDLLKPSNPTQALGINLASILIVGLGVWLVVMGIRRIVTQRTARATEESKSVRLFRRPRGVTMIALFMFWVAAFSLPLPGGIHFRGIGTIRGPWVLALCSFYIVVGIGLLKLSRWARAAMIVMAILDIALAGVALAHGLLQAPLLLLTMYFGNIPIYGVTLWYLLKPEVRLAFAQKTTIKEEVQSHDGVARAAER